MTKPNFFIIGAPKCGTTALSDYLRDHPNVYFSEPKEPHYFAEDLEKYRLTKTLDEYLGLFDGCSQEHTAIGEGSVFYLFSTVALEKIHKFNPQAKIIVMLRNPVDLVHSFHSQLMYSADEGEKDFEKAWHLQQTRREGKKIPRRCREASLLDYTAVGSLGEQIERLLNIFPPEQVKIIWFEDFIKSTKEVYDLTLDFLEIHNDNRTDFAQINENKVHKLDLISNLSEKPPKGLTNIALKVRDVFGIKRLYLLKTLRSLNTKVAKRKPLDDQLRREITAEFTSDIQRLSKQLNKDLNHWLLFTSSTK